MGHMKEARDSVELARLLSQEIYLSKDDEARETCRTQLELAKAEIEMALDELDRMEQLQELDE